MRAPLRQPLMVILLGLGGLAMLIPAGHAVVAGQFRVARAFGQSGVLLGVLALLLALALTGFRPANVARSHLAQLAGGFLLVPLALALPLWQLLPELSLVDGWFEMVSCLTGTGATLIDPLAVPPTLHLWRGLVGWGGGLLALVAAVAVLAPMTLGGFEVLSRSEAGRGAGGAIKGRAAAVPQIARIVDPSERMRRHAGQIAPAYAALTLALWLALTLAGDGALVALIQAMAVLSVSGIVAQPVGVALASGWVGEGLMAGFFVFALTAAALPGAHRRLPGKGLGHDREFRLALLLALLLLALLAARAMMVPATLPALWGGFFTALSFLSGVGLVSAGWEAAPGGSLLPWLLLAALALIGGGVATASSGMRLLRCDAMLTHARHEAERLVHPHAVGSAGPGARDLRRQGGQGAWIFALLLILSLAVAMLGLTLVGVGLEPALALSVAALTNVGPLAAVAAVGPAGGALAWAALPVGGKLMMMAAMLVGRLESLTLIALLAPAVWRRDPSRRAG